MCSFHLDFLSFFLIQSKCREKHCTATRIFIVILLSAELCTSTHTYNSYLRAYRFPCILVKSLQFVLVFDIHPRFSVTYYMSCLFAGFTNLNFSWIGDNKSMTLCMFMTISHYYYCFIVFSLLVRTRSISLSYYIYLYSHIYIYVFLLTCPICVRCAYSLPGSLNA